MSITVLIVDDEPLARAGIRTIIGTDPAIEVVGEAASGEEGLREAAQSRPAVVLMDIRMPGIDGIEATRRLTEGPAGAETKIVILTTFDQDEHVYAALRAGASGFLLKDSPPETLIAAIHTVANGEALLAPSVTRRLIAAFAKASPPATRRPVGFEELTPREIEVLELVGRGLSNSEIASRLYVSKATVKTHMSRILLKLGLRDRVGVVVLAYESGLIEPGAGA
jgi:DNA-binding NarL/FixJ family response regulator